MQILFDMNISALSWQTEQRLNMNQTLNANRIFEFKWQVDWLNVSPHMVSLSVEKSKRKY